MERRLNGKDVEPRTLNEMNKLRISVGLAMFSMPLPEMVTRDDNTFLFSVYLSSPLSDCFSGALLQSFDPDVKLFLGCVNAYHVDADQRYDDPAAYVGEVALRRSQPSGP